VCALPYSFVQFKNQSEALLVQSISVNSSQSFDAAVRKAFLLNTTQAVFELSPANLNTNTTRYSVVYAVFKDDRLFPSFPRANIVTPVVDLSLRNASLKGTFDFSFTPNNFSKANPYRCVFWNGTGWDSKGMTSLVSDSNIVCTSDHLTNFAVLVVR
jgi:hypothetical protein